MPPSRIIMAMMNSLQITNEFILSLSPGDKQILTELQIPSTALNSIKDAENHMERMRNHKICYKYIGEANDNSRFLLYCIVVAFGIEKAINAIEFNIVEQRGVAAVKEVLNPEVSNDLLLTIPYHPRLYNLLNLNENFAHYISKSEIFNISLYYFNVRGWSVRLVGGNNYESELLKIDYRTAIEIIHQASQVGEVINDNYGNRFF